MPHPNVVRFEEHAEARVFPRTTPEAISAMSRRQGIRVLTDWAAFLLERNGYDFNTVTVGRPLLAPSLLTFFRLLVVEAKSDGTVVNVQISYDE